MAIRLTESRLRQIIREEVLREAMRGTPNLLRPNPPPGAPDPELAAAWAAARREFAGKHLKVWVGVAGKITALADGKSYDWDHEFQEWVKGDYNSRKGDWEPTAGPGSPGYVAPPSTPGMGPDEAALLSALKKFAQRHEHMGSEDEDTDTLAAEVVSDFIAKSGIRPSSTWKSEAMKQVARMLGAR